MWVDFKRIDEVHEDRYITNGVVEGASAGRGKKKKKDPDFHTSEGSWHWPQWFLEKKKMHSSIAKSDHIVGYFKFWNLSSVFYNSRKIDFLGEYD